MACRIAFCGRPAARQEERARTQQKPARLPKATDDLPYRFVVVRLRYYSSRAHKIVRPVEKLG